jgi:hypothetical protein
MGRRPADSARYDERRLDFGLQIQAQTRSVPLVVIDGLFQFGARRAVESRLFHEEYLARNSAKTEAAG